MTEQQEVKGLWQGGGWEAVSAFPGLVEGSTGFLAAAQGSLRQGEGGFPTAQAECSFYMERSLTAGSLGKSRAEYNLKVSHRGRTRQARVPACPQGRVFSSGELSLTLPSSTLGGKC